MPLIRGTRLGPYEIIGPIAAGGMGEVYRAHDDRLGRDIALKILSPSVAANQSFVARFALEARAASALNHPNIVVVHDVCHHDPLPYITMELIDGASLRQLIDRGPMLLTQVLAIGVQVTDVLSAAHGRGIVHRDLKPENVMVTGSGLVKVLDFGLAKFDIAAAADHTAAAMIPTEAGTLLGTVDYMSPEQARGDSVDFRSDQFSFGTMLYEMVAGRLPFEFFTGRESPRIHANRDAKSDQRALMGSSRRRTAEIRSAGIPVRRACSRTAVSSGARYTQ